jgi:ketosteroid isomerase-like protein
MVHVESPTTTTTRAVVSAAYAAAGNSDMAAILEILDPDVVLHEPASLPNAGVHRGLQNVLRALAYVFEDFDMSRLTVDELIVDGERAVGLVNLTLRGREIQSSVAEVWRVRGGRVVEIRPYYFDTAAIWGPIIWSWR